ncbi:MAG: alcohol dehydrogenase catalytic domain-containing protein [Armatimonadetes bacterium]|jgi:threonine dehydrogenase-like Zn-dependent dehydrogenase|nr:alcohol dehydrogenase catalytic domain-containing protein [Armatimonadota bacterium]
MQALRFDGTVRLEREAPPPLPGPGEALVDVHLAGICATDLEITRGYMGYQGILGHEFVGTVRQSPEGTLNGQRVVGEINAGCGECDWCRRGLQTHCPTRTVIGIQGREGAFAEQIALPARNLHRVPAEISDEEAAFVEPLAAAFRIVEQVPVGPLHRVVLLGDGRLGLLAAQVLALTGCDLVALGHHPEKLALLEARGIRTAAPEEVPTHRADVVVDATGSPEGFAQALALTRPQGIVVLKTTCAGRSPVALAPLVVDEVTVVGSRCGPFAPALRALAERKVDVRPLIAACYPLSDGVAALEHAGRPGVLKVLLDCRA